MGFTPVHQRRCGLGFQGNEAPSGAGYLVSRLPVICEPNSGYTLTEFAGHLEASLRRARRLPSTQRTGITCCNRRG